MLLFNDCGMPIKEIKKGYFNTSNVTIQLAADEVIIPIKIFQYI